jgi:RimJ/RimL family protein N-acetyltransferase
MADDCGGRRTSASHGKKPGMPTTFEKTSEVGMSLRDVTHDDLTIFFEQQRDPEANRMAAFAAREWDDFGAHWRTNVLGNATALKQTAVLDENVAGYVSSWAQDGKRFLAFWIGRQYWGRGVATAAVLKFLNYESARPLYAYVASQNIGSIRVLEKCGFQRFGDSATGADGVIEQVYSLVA